MVLGMGHEGLIPSHKRSKRCPLYSLRSSLHLYSLNCGLQALGVSFFSGKTDNDAFAFILMFSPIIHSFVLSFWV